MPPNVDLIIPTIIGTAYGSATAVINTSVGTGIWGGIISSMGTYVIIRGISWFIGFLDHTRWHGWQTQQEFLSIEMTKPMRDLIELVKKINQKIDRMLEARK